MVWLHTWLSPSVTVCGLPTNLLLVLLKSSQANRNSVLNTVCSAWWSWWVVIGGVLIFLWLTYPINLVTLHHTIYVSRLPVLKSRSQLRGKIIAAWIDHPNFDWRSPHTSCFDVETHPRRAGWVHIALLGVPLWTLLDRTTTKRRSTDIAREPVIRPLVEWDSLPQTNRTQPRIQHSAQQLWTSTLFEGGTTPGWSDSDLRDHAREEKYTL